MIVSKLIVRNYRCFGDSPAVIEFSPSGLTALLGANNVGKSTTLKILEILLGDRWPSGQFTEDDFHDNKLDKDIVLICQFQHPISIRLNEVSINACGVAIKAKHLSSGYGESSVDIEYRILESLRSIETCDFDSLDIATYRWSNGKRGDKPIFINQEIKNQLPIVIIIPLIKLASEQPTNKWSVLGKMLQKVENLFSNNEGLRNEFREKMKDAVGVLRSPKDFKKIEEDIKEFWNVMKPTNLSDTHLEFLDFEPWRYYRQFRLSITRNGEPVPIENLGEGVQRLAVIALYRSYLKRHGRNERAVLLIEEPESYLHPQARKTLFAVLRDALKADEEVEGQIVYTTHSENFVDCGRFDDVVIFAKGDSQVEAHHLVEGRLRDHAFALDAVGKNFIDSHIHYRFIETITQGLKEALFAHKVIIVEGPSEIELFRLLTNADDEQVAIVSAGGKSNIPSVYTFLTAFGIPCLVVMDRDSKNKSAEKNDVTNKCISNILSQVNAKVQDTTKIQISLEEIKSIPDGEIMVKDRLLVFSKDLEAVLSRNIPEYLKMFGLLKKAFDLPDESKPRYIQALGLAFNGEFNKSEELKAEIKKAETSLKDLASKLNAYINQKVSTPTLLKPKPDDSRAAA